MLMINRLKCVLFINIVLFNLLNNKLIRANNNIKKAYLIENEKFLTWNASVEYCKSLNMSLFRIDTYEEFEYLKAIIKTKYQKIYPYWIGAYKISGVFKWISTGEDIKFFLWHAGEPNDKSGHEKCIHTWEEFFDWNDNDCERELPFICELTE